MTEKYVSLSKLSTFLDNLKKNFAAIQHTHTIAELTDYPDMAVSEITSAHIVHGTSKELLSNIINTSIMAIDYDSVLAFDTSEIVVDTIVSNNTSATLGQAILGQMILA